MINHIYETGIFPKSWGQSLITTIHKSGSVNDPNNYRGISVTNTLYTIFSRLIKTRLYNWAENHNKLNESQAGFRQGYSTVDNIFCLQAMAQKYLSKQGGRFYCLYVDFKKAFDRINHVKLFEVLHNKCLQGKFLRILKAMYTDLFSCVKVNSYSNNRNADVYRKDKTCYYKTTDYFPCNIGTKQGDVSSPTIFALFINELAESLRRSCGTGIFITNDTNDI